MTEPTTDTVKLALRPAVTEFVTRVRAQLADLGFEEQQELTDGLEADLSDLVAERGIEALGDPLAYARELRAAAGLDPVMGRARGAILPVGERVDRFLDATHARWDRGVAGLPGSPWELLVALHPVWWAFRAWLAVELVDLWFGGWPVTPVPSVLGPFFGLLLTVAAVVISTQIGRGKLWPGTRAGRSVGPRVLLLGLNAFAIVVAPVVLGQFPGSGSEIFEAGAVTPGAGGTTGPGLMVNDRFVENVYPYDAQGRPLTGVQLYDQNGRPLDVTRDPAYLDRSAQYRVTYPWRNGSAAFYNVFPLPQRVQGEPNRSADAFDETNPPTITPPLAAVLPVSVPGIEASVTRVPPAAKVDPKPRATTKKKKAQATQR